VRPVSVGNVLTANTATTLYTVPTGYYATCTLLHATNSTASNKHISFSWYDLSATTSIPLAFEYTIAAKTNFDPITDVQSFVMEEGDYITATSEAGATMSVVATFEVQGAQRT
jgi:hypothetical protein